MNISFPLTAEWYVMNWIYHHLFIYSPVDGHLSCFQFGAIVSNATTFVMNFAFN